MHICIGAEQKNTRNAHTHQYTHSVSRTRLEKSKTATLGRLPLAEWENEISRRVWPHGGGAGDTYLHAAKAGETATLLQLAKKCATYFCTFFPFFAVLPISLLGRSWKTNTNPIYPTSHISINPGLHLSMHPARHSPIHSFP